MHIAKVDNVLNRVPSSGQLGSARHPAKWQNKGTNKDMLTRTRANIYDCRAETPLGNNAHSWNSFALEP